MPVDTDDVAADAPEEGKEGVGGDPGGVGGWWERLGVSSIMIDNGSFVCMYV
jgi:hypothetical protein